MIFHGRFNYFGKVSEMEIARARKRSSRGRHFGPRTDFSRIGGALFGSALIGSELTG